MNRILFFLIPLFLGLMYSCEAQSEVSQKYDVQEVMRKINKIKQKYKIDISLKRPEKCTWNEVHYKLLTEEDYEQLLKYLDYIDEEFGKYPNRLWIAGGNPQLILVKDLFYQTQSRGGIPDCYLEKLYFDIHLGSYNEDYQRHVLHHEFYHMLEQQQNGDPYFKDPAWKKLNVEGFSYGTGGANDRDGNHSLLNHPQMGFITGYSMSGLEEDKSEIYASIWVNSERKKVASFRKKDPVLESKYQYMFKQLQRFCPEMDADFWKRFEKNNN